MLKRERWIVYPLLFLVISISLKDKLNSQQKSLRLKNIKVDQLEVGTIRGNKAKVDQIEVGTVLGIKANFREVGGGVIQTGQINVLDKQGSPKVVLRNAPYTDEDEPDATKTQGAISLLSGNGKEMLILGGGSGGGFIAARSDSDPQDFVALGYQAGRVGIFWIDDNGKQQGFLKPQKDTSDDSKTGVSGKTDTRPSTASKAAEESVEGGE